MRWLALAVVLVVAPVRADTVDDQLAKVRALYAKGEFAQARDELLAAYRLEPRPALLFALGQVELAIGHFAVAIDYYQRFIATEPAPEQARLAEQGIGAARARLAAKPALAPRPPPAPRPRWDLTDTGLTVAGSVAMVAGGALVFASYRLVADHGGRLSSYDARVSRAELYRTIGASGIAVGALTIGGALLRWRLHLVNTEVRPLVAPGTAGLSLERRW